MKNVRAMIECSDGFSFSIVANDWARCTDPEDSWRRKNGKRYWSDMEIGYPSNPDQLLAEYASPGPAGRLPETYDYVPLRVVKALVRKHGGVLSVTKWCRVCDRT